MRRWRQWIKATDEADSVKGLAGGLNADERVRCNPSAVSLRGCLIYTFCIIRCLARRVWFRPLPGGCPHPPPSRSSRRRSPRPCPPAGAGHRPPAAHATRRTLRTWPGAAEPAAAQTTYATNAAGRTPTAATPPNIAGTTPALRAAVSRRPTCPPLP
jgi:hypothetical protein